MLPYDPVVLMFGDSQMEIPGDTAAAAAYNAAYVPDAKVLTFNAAKQRVQYAPGTITGFGAFGNTGSPGPEIGFIPRFRADFPNNALTLIKKSIPGSRAGRGALLGSFNGYVSGNVLKVTSVISGPAPVGPALITGAGVPAGTSIANADANFSYLCKIGTSTLPNFTAGSAGSPIVFQHWDANYSWHLAEGIDYTGYGGSITNGFRQYVVDCLAAMTAAGLNPRIVAVLISLGGNDVVDAVGRSGFRQALVDFLAKLKADVPASFARIVTQRAPLSNAYGTNLGMTVRADQATIADADAQVYLMNSDDISFGSDNLHWSVAGRTSAGSRYYDVWTGLSDGLQPLVTFDPATLPAVTGLGLGESNRRVSASAGFGATRSTLSKAAPNKVYAEFDVVTPTNGQWALVNASANLASWLGGPPGNGIMIGSDGVAAIGGNTGPSGLGTIAAGDVLGIELDRTNGQCEWSLNGVYGGVRLPLPTGALFLACGGDNGFSTRLRTQASECYYSPRAGYSYWS